MATKVIVSGPSSGSAFGFVTRVEVTVLVALRKEKTSRNCGKFPLPEGCKSIQFFKSNRLSDDNYPCFDVKNGSGSKNNYPL
jgi:hypothetical protein